MLCKVVGPSATSNEPVISTLPVNVWLASLGKLPLPNDVLPETTIAWFWIKLRPENDNVPSNVISPVTVKSPEALISPDAVILVALISLVTVKESDIVTLLGKPNVNLDSEGLAAAYATSTSLAVPTNDDVWVNGTDCPLVVTPSVDWNLIPLEALASSALISGIDKPEIASALAVILSSKSSMSLAIEAEAASKAPLICVPNALKSPEPDINLKAPDASVS